MSQTNTDINLLQALYRAGRHAELEVRARAFLLRKPNQGKVWHLLARARMAQGHLAAAREALERASALLPGEALVWNELGLCRHGLGEREAAADCFERSLALVQDRADVWAAAGRNALELGRHEVAARHCERALELRPDLVEACFNLGKALAALGRRDEASSAYRRVLDLAPNVAEAQNAAAVGLLELGQAEVAIEACRRALHLNPQFAPAELNLGNALWELGRTADAVTAYRRALELRPDFAEAYSNLGNALNGLERFEDAEVAYSKALELQPEASELRYRLGGVLRRLKRFDDAVALYQDLLALNPDDAVARHQLALVFQDAGRRDDALAAWERAIAVRPDFSAARMGLADCLIRSGRPGEAIDVFKEALRQNIDDRDAWDGMLFALNYLPTASTTTALEQARAFATRVAAQVTPFADHDNRAEPKERLRVGLVSGDFGDHPVGLFLVDVVANLDADRIELHAYETFKRTGKLNARLRRLIPHWRDAAPARLSDAALARMIHDDAIDILIDLAGHTAHNRLPVFACRPAPVQVAWLGYFATTGLPAMDWILADRWVLPPDEEDHFVERAWRLPDSYYCFSPPDVPLDLQPPPVLRNGYVTFGCFNNLGKLNDGVVACWARVLAAVPSSRLFLKTRALGDAAVVADFRDRFRHRGIPPERLRFEGASPREEYLAAYGEVDIALDPYPFPGGTTSLDGLWMGVPVVTLRGRRFIGHQGETILQSLGLSDWIAIDEDAYVARAAAVAANPVALAVLRADLRQRLLASPLCNAPRFARNLEQALQDIWLERCARRA